MNQYFASSINTLSLFSSHQQNVCARLTAPIRSSPDVVGSVLTNYYKWLLFSISVEDKIISHFYMGHSLHEKH